jgi:uncharacterized protein with ParB-like and HNH nuclease domain
MHAEEKHIINIFSDPIKYVIPDYQRPYSWETNESIQLYEDILEAIEIDAQEYFIGSIILIKKQDRYEVVDGQQRITTITLMLSAIMNALNDEDQKSHIRKYIMQYNPMTKIAGECRLNVRKADSIFYRNIINWQEDKNTALTESQDRMLENRNALYNKFRELSQDNIVKFEQYLENKVLLVWVYTESFPSAFRLFNVLNARGMPLSNSDLIKNHILSKAKDIHGQNEIVEIWEDIEDKIQISGLDDYFGHLRTAILGTKQVGTLQESFSKIIDDYKNPINEFAKNLLRFANMYIKIRDGDFSDVNTKRHYISLQRVFYKEWIPVLLCYLNANIKNTAIISECDFIILLERITYQNWVRNLGRTKRVQVYYDLINVINSNFTKDSISAVLEKHKNNVELRKFLEEDVYGRPYAKSLLLKIEDMTQDASVIKSYNGLITIEHILPQTITDDYWKQRFNYDEHELIIHKIGNLTLLSGRKNSAAQNYDFNAKKDIYLKKDKKVSFDMTKEICAMSEWNKVLFDIRQKDYVDKLYSEFKIES